MVLIGRYYTKNVVIFFTDDQFTDVVKSFEGKGSFIVLFVSSSFSELLIILLF